MWKIAFILSIVPIIISGPVFAGFIMSAFRRGAAGVDMRLNIGLAYDRLIAASWGWPDGRMVSGYVGERAAKSNKLAWRIAEYLIDSFPFWKRGHCREIAIREGVKL